MNTPIGVSYKTTAPIVDPAKPAKALLYRVRLKDGHDVREVVVSASSLEQASDVGMAYCTREKYRFIRVEPMVVADPSILN